MEIYFYGWLNIINLRFKNINGTLARDDVINAVKNDLKRIIWRYKKLIPTAFSSGWDFKTSNNYKILKEL